MAVRFALSDQHGHVVFLDFYASWCEPCKIEFPLVSRWAPPSWRGCGADRRWRIPRSLAAFARQYSLVNVALDPKSSATALFGVEGFPTIVVIDSSGDVRAKWAGLNPAIGFAMTNAEENL